ncbi:hypothetical protein F7725_021384 [Dissostichus mawsoni]|uniref:Dynein heavy chain 3 AAA+ lid domain-containing protein n=1 Tax=Dissostichus mawsoni TaxID=36200 RepID=A0A7J5ZB16_DISMA|nr:hypothetical protein F7725_021384 [Dissostichus mawsoni]
MDMPVGLRDGTSNRGSADGARISAVADTGAQSDLWSLEEFLACGFARDDLRPVSLSLSAANRSPIAIEGAFFARLSTTCSGGRVTSCRSMVYVSSSVRAMYLSYESLLNLSLLPVNFPSDDVAGGPKDRRSPDTADTPDQPLSVNATRSTNGGCVGPAEALSTIYTSILSQLQRCPAEKLPPLVQLSLALHQRLSSIFLPTAVKFHYIFNLRDLSNIFQDQRHI